MDSQTESCSEEILTITIQDYNTKKIITWGVKPFNNTQSNVTYRKGVWRASSAL